MSSDNENRAQSPVASDRKDASDASDSGDIGKLSSPPRDASGSPPVDDVMGEGDNDADLFGSGSEDEEPVYVWVRTRIKVSVPANAVYYRDRRPQRKLDDEELDSGDDADRYDRRETPMYEDEEVAENTQLNVMEVELGRAAEPDSTDGQVRGRTVYTTRQSRV